MGQLRRVRRDHGEARLIARSAFAALGLALALGSPVAAIRPALQPSQCRGGETVVYSCRFGASVGSLCGTKGKLSYRFGPAGRPTIDIATDATWSNARTGTIVGGGGGYQNHVRFSRDGHDYIVYEAMGGRLTEVPGKRWSGIHVGKGDADVADLTCKGRATLARPGLSDLTRFMPPGIAGTTDEPDRTHDMWY